MNYSSNDEANFVQMTVYMHIAHFCQIVLGICTRGLNIDKNDLYSSLLRVS